MPELPEVETVRRAIEPGIRGRRIEQVVVRQPRLRWPVQPRLVRELPGQQVHTVQRRGKYLLLQLDTGTLLVHLGMSGSLRILNTNHQPGPHDHLDLCFHKCLLRLHDPRRFGSIHWTRADPNRHRLLRDLGAEPLGPAFNGAYLYNHTRNRQVAIKNLLMNSHVVAGLGNIYANEALHDAGIHPTRSAGRISQARCERLATAIRAVLHHAITAGGTTLRDFRTPAGRRGYFQIDLKVYNRAGQPCPNCTTPIRRLQQGQRSTFYCPRCQR